MTVGFHMAAYIRGFCENWVPDEYGKILKATLQNHSLTGKHQEIFPPENKGRHSIIALVCFICSLIEISKIKY